MCPSGNHFKLTEQLSRMLRIQVHPDMLDLPMKLHPRPVQFEQEESLLNSSQHILSKDCSQCRNCKYCTKNSQDRVKLNHHMNTHSHDGSNVTPPPGIYTVISSALDIPPKDATTTMVAKGTIFFNCATCAKLFIDNHTLQEHMKIHLVKDAKDESCKYCMIKLKGQTVLLILSEPNQWIHIFSLQIPLAMSSRTWKAALPMTSPQTKPLDLSYAGLARSRPQRPPPPRPQRPPQYRPPPPPYRPQRPPQSRRPPPQERTSKPTAAAKGTSQKVPWLGHPETSIRTTLTQRIFPGTGTTEQAGRTRSPTPHTPQNVKRTTNPEPNRDSRSLNLTTDKPPSSDTAPPQVLYLRMRNGPALRYKQEVQTTDLTSVPDKGLSKNSIGSDTVIKHYTVLLTVGLHLLTLALVAKVILTGA